MARNDQTGDTTEILLVAAHEPTVVEARLNWEHPSDPVLRCRAWQPEEQTGFPTVSLSAECSLALSSDL